MPVTTEDRTLQVLREIHEGNAVSQRRLADSLGIALGLTNSLVKRLIWKGYVRVTGVPRSRIRYLLTPRGVAEMTRRAADSMENTISLYTDTRDRLRTQLSVLEALAGPDGCTRVIFYGAGEVAEIAYITLPGSRLELVAVIDDRKVGSRFFEHTIAAPESLVDGTAPEHDVIAVMTFKKATQIAHRLTTLGVPAARIFQLSQSVVQCLPNLASR